MHYAIKTFMEWKFCPRCATGLQLIEKSGAVRPVCPACGFVHFADPKVTVCVLIVQAGKVLLGLRDMEPQRGKWCLPGGFMDYGEQVRAAAAREALEETGLVVEVGELLVVSDWDDTQFNKKGIALAFAATVLSGTPRADDDVAELGWFAVDELPEMAFPSDMLAIKEYHRRSSQSFTH
jgi:8-oxo-dGTP diphosphatase